MKQRILWSLWLITMLLPAACAAQMPVREASLDYEGAVPAEPASGDMWAEEEGLLPTASDADEARRIISTARLELVVQDTSAVAGRIAAIAVEHGGYVGSTNLYKASYDGGDALRGSLTLRVPAESLDQVIEELEALAVDVRSKSTDRQDVTDQYSDLQARLRTLEATEVELLELLTEVRAKPNATADEIMAVYQRLTEIRTEIERLQGRLNLLESQIRLSTLEVSLVPDPGERPLVQAGWQPSAEARAALRTLVSATQGLANLLIWAVLFILPLLLLLLIPVAIAGYVLRLLYRRYNRNKRTAPSV